MFKKFTDKMAKKVESSVKREVRSTVNRAKSQAKSAVRQGVKNAVNKEAKRMLVAGSKEVDKKIKGKLITDFNELKKAWEKEAGDPIKSVFYFLMAAYNYLDDEQKGENMATIMLPKTFLLDDKSSPTGFKLNPKGDEYLMNHMKEDPNIVYSYLGGTPDNGYEVDEKNLEMWVVGELIEEKEATITLQSAGKDLPTPVGARKNKNGQWKLFSISSIATGVQKTTDEIDDF